MQVKYIPDYTGVYPRARESATRGLHPGYARTAPSAAGTRVT